jgi:hypothetical protein
LISERKFPKYTFDSITRYAYDISRQISGQQQKTPINLRGRVRFPTGGTVRELTTMRGEPIRCNSETNSIVWMEEEPVFDHDVR